jgi:hypothetical protein
LGAQGNSNRVRCIDLTGNDLSAFLKAAAGAGQRTVWTAPSGRYTVSIRLLYPEEKDCPPAAG